MFLVIAELTGCLQAADRLITRVKKGQHLVSSNAVQTVDKTIILITLWCSTNPSAIKTLQLSFIIADGFCFVKNRKSNCWKLIVNFT